MDDENVVPVAHITSCSLDVKPSKIAVKTEPEVSVRPPPPSAGDVEIMPPEVVKTPAAKPAAKPEAKPAAKPEAKAQAKPASEPEVVASDIGIDAVECGVCRRASFV